MGDAFYSITCWGLLIGTIIVVIKSGWDVIPNPKMKISKRTKHRIERASLTTLLIIGAFVIASSCTIDHIHYQQVVLFEDPVIDADVLENARDLNLSAIFHGAYQHVDVLNSDTTKARVWLPIFAVHINLLYLFGADTDKYYTKTTSVTLSNRTVNATSLMRALVPEHHPGVWFVTFRENDTWVTPGVSYNVSSVNATWIVRETIITRTRHEFYATFLILDNAMNVSLVATWYYIAAMDNVPCWACYLLVFCAYLVLGYSVFLTIYRLLRTRKCQVIHLQDIEPNQECSDVLNMLKDGNWHYQKELLLLGEYRKKVAARMEYLVALEDFGMLEKIVDRDGTRYRKNT